MSLRHLHTLIIVIMALSAAWLPAHGIAASDVNRSQPSAEITSAASEIPTLKAAASRKSSCQIETQQLIESAQKHNRENHKNYHEMTPQDRTNFINTVAKATQPNGRLINIPTAAVIRTIDTFMLNQESIYQQDYITIIDFSKRSDELRLFIFDRKGHLVESLPTSHGHGSDPNGTSLATSFSNKPESQKTSAGCFLIGQTYVSGRHGQSQKLVGFESGPLGNDNNCKRGITMHPASYVGDRPGRSWGCVAYHPADRTKVQKIQRPAGSLVCTYPSPQDLDQNGRFRRGR